MSNNTPKTVLVSIGLAVEAVFALLIFVFIYQSFALMDDKNAPTAETYVKIGLLGVLLSLGLALAVRLLSPLVSDFARDHKVRRVSLPVLLAAQAAVLIAFAGTTTATLSYLILELTGPGSLKAYLDTRVETNDTNAALFLVEFGLLGILAAHYACRAILTHFVARSREKANEELIASTFLAVPHTGTLARERHITD